MDILPVGPAVCEVLDRQQARREAGLPTVSVLRGAVGLGVQVARDWARKRGCGVAVVATIDPPPGTLVDAWADALAGGCDLRHEAVAWLARRLDRPAAALGAALERRSPLERDTFLGTALPTESDPAAACRWLLAQPAEALREPGLAGRLAAALGGDDAHLRVAAALVALIPPAAAPVLLAVPPAAHDAAAWLGAAAPHLARLAEAEPRLPLVVAIAPEALDRYQTAGPESRARALIRSGTVAVNALDGPAIGRRLDAAFPGAAARLAASIARLAADGASERLVDLFVDAVRTAQAPGAEPSNLARSAAERFLFERLESLPQTTGLFMLNARLDFHFGPDRAIEVDLAAKELTLALEVDGYYHFRNADDYRRDRRKDLELQKHGWLVVRVLADDVVGRLEDVLNQVLAAVAHRRSRNPQGAGS